MIVYVASSAQNLFGMGWGMIAAPFLALLDPYLIPSTIVFLGFLPHSFQASDIIKIFIGKHLGRRRPCISLYFSWMIAAYVVASGKIEIIIGLVLLVSILVSATTVKEFLKTRVIISSREQLPEFLVQ